ncbi:MAG: Na+/H+ antiporter NhaC family protein, partial [Myxococcota bacterium]
MPADLPSWLALLPPIVAIGLALAIREVVVALYAGVFLGATLVAGGDPLTGALRSIDQYAVGAVADADHAAILLFSLMLGGMVGVVTRSGGAAGLAAWVTRRATTAKRGQLATWGLGLLVFFDDYANSLLVGASMRPITDRLKVSREKLAVLVDATAAPVASLALVSSWVGVEVGYIADELESAGLDLDAYVAFL